MKNIVPVLLLFVIIVYSFNNMVTAGDDDEEEEEEEPGSSANHNTKTSIALKTSNAKPGIKTTVTTKTTFKNIQIGKTSLKPNMMNTTQNKISLQTKIITTPSIKSLSTDVTTDISVTTSTESDENYDDTSSCKRPECISYNCARDPKSFHSNGSRKVSPSIGRISHVCNKTYLFSKMQANWKLAQEICCTFNMRLVNFETPEQMKCIRSLNVESGVHPILSLINYWVGGSDEECEGKFGWCEIGKPFSNWTTWGKYEPNNLMGIENCVALITKIALIRSEQYSVLGDRDCDMKNQFICEEDNITAVELTKRGVCKKPRCLPHKCVIDKNMVAANGTRNVPPRIGKLVHICNKTYVFGKIEVNWIRAQEICCAFNMRLLTIESLEQMKCIRKLDYNSGVHKGLGWHSYWTGGTDEKCEGKFMWCKTRNIMLQNWLIWYGKSPDNFLGVENCVGLDFLVTLMRSMHDSYFNDMHCNSTRLFICEEIYTHNSNNDTKLLNTPIKSIALNGTKLIQKKQSDEDKNLKDEDIKNTEKKVSSIKTPLVKTTSSLISVTNKIKNNVLPSSKNKS